MLDPEAKADYFEDGVHWVPETIDYIRSIGHLCTDEEALLGRYAPNELSEWIQMDFPGVEFELRGSMAPTLSVLCPLADQKTRRSVRPTSGWRWNFCQASDDALQIDLGWALAWFKQSLLALKDVHIRINKL